MENSTLNEKGFLVRVLDEPPASDDLPQEDQNETSMDFEEEALLPTASADDDGEIPDAQPQKLASSKPNAELFERASMERKRKINHTQRPQGGKKIRRETEVASIDTKIEKSRNAIEKLRIHIQGNTCPKTLRYNVRANITHDEQFKKEIGSIRKNAEQEVVRSLAKFHQRRIDRLQTKRRQVELEQPKNSAAFNKQTVPPVARRTEIVTQVLMYKCLQRRSKIR